MKQQQKTWIGVTERDIEDGITIIVHATEECLVKKAFCKYRK